MKLKRCKICKEPFTPVRQFQSCCDYACAIEHAKRLKEKKQARDSRKKKSEQKEKLKTRTEHLNELQVIFNQFIRLRDKDAPCISCGNNNDVKFDAGHFFSCGGYPAMRFQEDCCHKQCVGCNRDKHGNLIEYRERLIEKIGKDRFDYMDSIKHNRLALSLPEILELKKSYRAKIKLLKNN